MRLRFDGKLLRVTGRGRSVQYPAASGKEATPKSEGFEPLPEGSYWIQSDEIHELGVFDDLSAKLGAAALALSFERAWEAHTAAWGRYRIPIRQTGRQRTKTGRGQFFIHGGKTPGSAGCIDLTSQMPSFVHHIREAHPEGRGFIPLQVKYERTR